MAKNYILSPKDDQIYILNDLIQRIEKPPFNGKILKHFAFIDSYVVSLPQGFDFNLLSGVVVEEDREMMILKTE